MLLRLENILRIRSGQSVILPNTVVLQNKSLFTYIITPLKN